MDNHIFQRAAGDSAARLFIFENSAIIFQKHVTFLVPMLSNRVKGPNRKEV